MIYLFLAIAVCALVYGPQLWVRYVLHKHQKTIPDMPGTGGELAEHLIERFNLTGVVVKQGGKDQNYYSPDEKIVCLSPENHNGKSLSAVATAAHEVGHAIQFIRQEPISRLRTRYLSKVFSIRRISSILLSIMTLAAIVLHSPHFIALTILVGITSMLISVLMYVAVLPEEYDASFNKALPILKEGYVPERYLPAIRSILKACALTYVAGALTEVLSLWRWVRYLR